MTKKPQAVKIGTLNYSIEYHPSLIINGTELLYGHCLNSEVKLQINEQYPEEKQRETFVHECLHAIDERCLNGKLDEDQIAVLASGIFDWIRNNPDAIDWVKGK